MDSSPSKRRKISPTTSVPVDATTTPSRIPIRKDATNILSHRPSFASPTRSSIARHNPQLLKPSSSPGGGRLGSRGTRLDDDFAKALGLVHPSTERQDVISGEEATISFGSTTVENETLEEDRTTAVATQSNRRKSLSVGGGLSEKSRRMSRSPTKQTPRAASTYRADTSVGQGFQGMVDPFKKTGLRRSPPAASQVVQAQEADFNPFQKKGLRRSPIAIDKLPTTENQDLQETEPPELSTTPKSPPNPQDRSSRYPMVQDEPRRSPPRSQGPIAPESASFDIPQPTEQSVATASNSPETSPLVSQAPLHDDEGPDLTPVTKQLAVADPVFNSVTQGIHDSLKSKARRNKDLTKKIPSSPLKPQPQRVLEPTKASKPQFSFELVPEKPHAEKPKRRKSARFSISEDPHQARKKVRDDLLKELQQLQADVALANQENRRLQTHYESKSSPPNDPSNSEELLNLLVRSTVPEPAPVVNATRNSAFKSIGSFLPFSSRRKRMSKTSPVFNKPIPSHLPIEVDNPLPYLQAFSPLTYTSKITLLPPESQATESSLDEPSKDAQSISQLHLITASHFSGLFVARLSMIVNTDLLSISSIHIERLPPCAEKELGIFFGERLTHEEELTKDIGLICWAMSRWVDVSVQRSKFWCTVAHELGTPEARAKSLQRKKKKRKRRQVVVEDDDDDVPLDGLEEEELKKQKWSRRDLLPHMGRTAMELSNDKVELRIEWRIKFDWTGEADSSITASVRLPKSWQETDDRKSLLKVPESFAKLLKQKGPLGAVRTVVGLLMPEPS